MPRFDKLPPWRSIQCARNLPAAQSDGAVVLWTAGRRKQHNDSANTLHDVTSAAFSSDGGKLLTASEERFVVWGSSGGSKVAYVSIRRKNVSHHATFSPDAASILATSASGAIVLNTKTGETQRKIPGPCPILSLSATMACLRPVGSQWKTSNFGTRSEGAAS